VDYRLSFSDGIGVFGIILAVICLVLDKAGKLKGGWLIGLLFLAGAMTLFLAIGNSWVLDAPAKWKIWRGSLLFSVVALTYSGMAIWITSPEGTRGIATQQPESQKHPIGPEKSTAPVKHPKKKSPPQSPVPLQSLSDGQRFALKKELSVLAGNSLRIVQIGNDSNAQILNEQLLDVFTGWNICNPSIGQGPNVSSTPYLTSLDVSSQLVGQVYAIFHRFGVEINLVPSNAYMGPASLGPPNGIVIVIK
jgi:hypothetical protein